MGDNLIEVMKEGRYMHHITKTTIKIISFLLCFSTIGAFTAGFSDMALTINSATGVAARAARVERPGTTRIVASAPTGNQQLEVPHRFYAYERLDHVNSSGRRSFSPQTVRVLEQGKPNTYLISTYLGPRWIYFFDKYEKIVNPYVPYTYEQQIIDAIKLESMYPDLISVSEIGSSVEKRQIISIRLGKGSKSIVMVGSHHAREYITSTYLMKMIDEYAFAYYSTGKFGNYDMKSLLDAVTIHVVVMLNPDGVNLVQNGPDAVSDRKALDSLIMTRPSYREWKNNINGVNLNANYPAEWEAKQSAKSPDSEKFKGYSPGSEPETQALMEYTKNNSFILAASMHTKGEVIYWADRRTQNLVSGQRQIAQEISKSTGYPLTSVSWQPATYAAGYENWFRAEFLKPAFCIELTPLNGNSHPHKDSDFDRVAWNKAKDIGAVLATETLKR